MAMGYGKGVGYRCFAATPRGCGSCSSCLDMPNVCVCVCTYTRTLRQALNWICIDGRRKKHRSCFFLLFFSRYMHVSLDARWSHVEEHWSEVKSIQLWFVM